METTTEQIPTRVSNNSDESIDTLRSEIQAMAQGLARQLAQSLAEGLELGLTRIHAALSLKMVAVQRDTQEALRSQKEEARNELQQGVINMETQMRLNDDALRATVISLEERALRIEEKLEAVECRTRGVTGGGIVDTDGGRDTIEGLEARMTQLEASLQRALNSVFPRVNALLAQLEEQLPPKIASSLESSNIASSSDSPSTSTSVSDSSSSSPPTSHSSAVPPPHRPVASPTLHEAYRQSPGMELYLAAREGRVADVRRALDGSGDVNFITPGGETPLMAACAAGCEEIVSLLLLKGADVNAKGLFGLTALHRAAERDSSGQCISRLISAGADVNVGAVDGRSPLHLAVLANNAVAVRLLLEATASPSVTDVYGKTPLQLARTPDIRKLFAYLTR